MQPSRSFFRRLLAPSTLVICASLASASPHQIPDGSPRIGFAPIGTPFASSAAYSYLAGRPVVRLPNGIVIDPNNSGVGATFYDPAQQQAATQERYQVENAQAAQAYQQSMAMQQKAMQQANTKGKNRSAIRQGFDPRTGAPYNPSATAQAKAGPALFDEAGSPVWPTYAPKNAGRTSVDEAIQAVRAEVKQNGFASVATTVRAKEALRTYGVPAMKGVPGGSKVLAERLREHLVRLDSELDKAAEPPSETK